MHHQTPTQKNISWNATKPSQTKLWDKFSTFSGWVLTFLSERTGLGCKLYFASCWSNHYWNGMSIKQRSSLNLKNMSKKTSQECGSTMFRIAIVLSSLLCCTTGFFHFLPNWTRVAQDGRIYPSDPNFQVITLFSNINSSKTVCWALWCLKY